MLGIPYPMVLLMAVMGVFIACLMTATVGAKALRRAVQRRHDSRRSRIEPALEAYAETGEPQADLEALGRRERDRFLAPMMIERMSLLRGADRERMAELARRLGMVDRYLADLESRNRWRRALAAERLGHFGAEVAVAPLCRLLSDEDETVRAVAARALARLGTNEAVEALARTLDDPSEITRLRVSENLHRIGHPAVPHLVNLLEESAGPGAEEHVHGAILASRVLGGLRAHEARPALALAARRGATPDIRAQATRALGRIGDLDDLPLLVENTRDSEWPVRTQAANALGLIGDRDSIPVLRELVSDRSWWVRVAAARALASMGTAGEDALIELLYSEDRFASERAAAALEERGITRRLVRGLPRADARGERARRAVSAIADSGATRYLWSLLEHVTGDERRELERILAAAPEPQAPAMAETADATEPVKDE